MSWLEKYQPRTIENLIIDIRTVTKIKKWFTDFKNLKNVPNVLIINGPPGCGKTVMTSVFLEQFQFRKQEYNCSNLMKKKNIIGDLNDILNKKNIVNMFQNKKIETAIIIDEVDSISKIDKLFMSEIVCFVFPKEKKRYLKYSPFIFLTSSLTKKCLALKKKSVYIELEYPSLKTLTKLCSEILNNENITIDNKEITKIIKSSKYDIRQTIINLELNYRSFNKKNQFIQKYTTFEKDFIMEEYKLTELFLSRYKTINNVVIYNNINKVHMLFYENFCEFIIKNKINTDIIRKIYKNYSDSDIFDFSINLKLNYYDIIPYNNIFKLYDNSFKLSNFKDTKMVNINYSMIINKISLEYINIKNITMIQNMLYSFSESITIYDIIFLLDIIIKNNEYNKILEMYNIDKKFVKKFIKYM
jgi:DNA polymerase III delta prime subunit